MSVRKLLDIGGQQSLLFGSRGDAAYAHAEPRAVIAAITPAMADNFLKGADPEGLGSPRHLANVATYARAMRALAWRLNGDAVVLDTTGRIVDGRARCQACVEARAAFPAILFTGVPADAEFSIDMKSVRSKADTLYVKGLESPSVVARACENVYRFLNEPHRELFVANRAAAQPMDNAAVKLMTELHPQIVASARLANNAHLPGFSNAALAAAHFLMGLVDPIGADRFMIVLAKPELDPGSVPGRLARAARRKGADLASGRDTKAMAIIGKCWLAFLAETPYHQGLKRYNGRIEGDDTGREGFPGYGVPPDRRITLAPVSPGLVLGVDPEDPAAIEAHVRATIAASGVTASIEDVGTVEAMAMLARNGPNGGRNRKLHPDQVEYLGIEIKEGRWILNGQGIKIGATGCMLDGQHRCTAVAQTGTAIRTLVVRGLDDEVFATFDGGQRSSYAKRAAPRSTYAHERGAALRVIGMIEAGDEAARITATRQRQLEQGYPDLERGIVASRKAGAILSNSVGAALYAILSRIDGTATQAFFRSLADGEDLDEDMPVYQLREKLLRHGRSKSDRIHAKHARWTIHAWNANYEGRALTRIKDTRGPGFPPIAGFSRAERATERLGN